MSNTAVVVFYGGMPGHTQARLAVGAAILQDCPDFLGFLVGGSRPAQGYFGAEEMASALADIGIERGRLFSEKASFDTVSNVEEVLSLVRAHGTKRLIFVSDALHIRRLTFLARRVGLDRIASIDTVVAAPEDQIAPLWRPAYEAIAWIAIMVPESARNAVLRIFRS